jgi:hypothetical protein
MADTTISISGDASGLVGALGSVVGVFENLFGTIAGGVAVGEAINGIFEKTSEVVINFVEHAAMAGARLEQLSGVAQFLGERAGYTRGEVRDLADQLQRTGITGVEANSALLQMIRYNIDLSKAVDLQAAAQNAASIAGKSSSEVLGALIQGITTLQPRLLETNGYIVTLRQVENEWARETGGNIQQLSGHEKQQLLLNAVLKQAAEIQGVYSESLNFAAKQAQSSQRAMEQLEEQIGLRLLPATNAIISAWYHLLENLRDSVAHSEAVDAVFRELGADVRALGTDFGPLLETLGEIAKWTGYTTLQFLADATSRLRQELKDAADSTKDHTDNIVSGFMDAHKHFMQFLSDVAGYAGVLAHGAEGSTQAALKALEQSESYKKLHETTTGLMTAEEAEKAMAEQTRKERAASVDITDQVNARVKAFREAGLVPLTETQREWLGSLVASNATQAEAVKITHIGEQQVKAYYEQHKEAEKAVKAHTKEIEAQQKALDIVNFSFQTTQERMSSLSIVDQQAVRDALEHGAKVADVAKAYGLQKEAVQAVDDQLKFEHATISATIKAVGDHQAQLVPLVARYGEWHSALTGVNDETKLLPSRLIDDDKAVYSFADSQAYAQQKTKELRDALKAFRAEQTDTPWYSPLVAGLEKLPQLMEQALTGGGGVVGALRAVGASIGTDFAKQFMSHTLSNIADNMPGLWSSSIGTALGMAMPAIGSMIGAFAPMIFSGIKRLFGGPPEWEKIGSDIARDYGEHVSDKLAKAIEADEKKIGDRVAATLNHLGDLVKEAGGITTDNMQLFTGKVHDLYTMLSRHLLDTKQVAAQVNEVFPQLAQTIVDSHRIADQSFVDLIRLNQQFGTEASAVAKFVSDQFSQMAAGNKAVTTSFYDEVAKASKKSVAAELGDRAEVTKGYKTEAERDADLYKAWQNEIAKLAEEGKQDEIQRATDTYNKKRQLLHDLYATTQSTTDEIVAATALGNQKVVADYQQEFDRLSRITLATFNAEIAQGKDAATAIADVGPSIDQLTKASGEFGFAGNEAFDKLKQWRQLTQDNAGLLASVKGINDMMLAMANIGQLDTQTFADMQTQGLSTYQKLIAAGFTQQQAEAQMKPLLETMIDLHNKRGMKIDEETAKMIEQARQDGVITGDEMKLNDILMQGLGSLIEAVGGKLPEAWRQMGRAAGDNIDAATGKTRGTLHPAIDDTSAKLQGTPWETYAGRAQSAASTAAGSVSSVGGAAQTAANQVANSTGAFQTWADNAANYAARVRAEIDGISFGSSPGGIKEIALKLREATEATRDWHTDTVMRARAVRDVVDQISAGRVGGGLTVANAAFAAHQTVRMQTPVVVQVSNPIFLNPETVRQFTSIISGQLAQDLSREIQFDIASPTS